MNYSNIELSVYDNYNKVISQFSQNISGSPWTVSNLPSELVMVYLYNSFL